MREKRKFVFYSADVSAFDPWDWTAIERGIGGSETCHIELARRLHQRGHEVVNFAPIPGGARRDELGLLWEPSCDARWNESGTWIIFRTPETADHFGPVPSQAKLGQSLWLICEDVDYPGFSRERAGKFQSILALSQMHARYLSNKYGYPNIGISSNGIASDRMAALPANLPRNPKRLIYSSSPDRGLIELLGIFRRVREYVPDAELHVFYGFNNIDIAIERYVNQRGGEPGNHPWRKAKDAIMRECQQPGVVWRGRVGQTELWREFLQVGIWCYPTWFAETSCISCMEAQALGAVPVTRPYWPLAENVQHGVLIEGDPNDPLTLARYIQEIVKLMEHPKEQDRIRTGMMPWAREYFDWELVADQMEDFTGLPLIDYTGSHYWLATTDCRNDFEPLPDAWTFQRKHCQGRVLNVGCDTDAAGLGPDFNAVNVDLVRQNPVSGAETKPRVLADARLLAFSRQFDTVVLGDVLEHFSPLDAVLALRQARECLRNGGRIVITCPDDRRTLKQQISDAGSPVNGTESYGPGITAFHQPVSRESLELIVRRAGLHVTVYEQYQTPHYTGHGIVAEAEHAV